MEEKKKHTLFTIKGKTYYPLVIILFILITIGLITLYSVSGPSGYGSKHNSLYYTERQVAFTIAGLFLCFVINFVDIHWLKNIYIGIISYGVSLGLIILTAVIGTDLGQGAKRWIGVGTFTLQTSEVAKIGLVLAYACYRAYVLEQRKAGKLKFEKYSKFWRHVFNTFVEFLIPLLLAGVCDVFIVMQPHVSCAFIIFCVMMICLAVSGIRARYFFTGILIAIPIIAVLLLAAIAFSPNLKQNFAHVFTRVAIFNSQRGDEEAAESLDEDDTRQVDHAMNALGSGGLWGIGLGESRSKYSYVSEAQNDYITSIYIEESGFVGGLVLVLAYLAFFYSGMTVAKNADSVFSRMIAAGCVSLIVVEALFNMCVNLQLVPPTGVTLPFVSYGGTAQIFLLICYGLVLSVARSGTINSKDKVAMEAEV